VNNGLGFGVDVFPPALIIDFCEKMRKLLSRETLLRRLSILIFVFAETFHQKGPRNSKVSSLLSEVSLSKTNIV